MFAGSGDNHRRPFGLKQFCRLRTDACSAPANECDLAVELAHGFYLLGGLIRANSIARLQHDNYIPTLYVFSIFERSFKTPKAMDNLIREDDRAVYGDRGYANDRMFGYREVRYRGITKNTAQVFALLALANLFLARRTLASV